MRTTKYSGNPWLATDKPVLATVLNAIGDELRVPGGNMDYAGDSPLNAGNRARRVLLVHNDAGAWKMVEPNGAITDVTASTTNGLQEAITYKNLHGYHLDVVGGGYTNPRQMGGGNPVSRLRLLTPISVPTMWTDTYRFEGVSIHYDVLGGADETKDVITFDSADMGRWHMYGGELLNAGKAACIRFKPDLDNGENFGGITSSRFDFGTLVCVDPTTLAPRNTFGKGVQFTMAAGGHGYAQGNGKIDLSEFVIQEINGSAVAVQIDAPGAGNRFWSNTITCKHAHGYATRLVNNSGEPNNRIDWGATPPARDAVQMTSSPWITVADRGYAEFIWVSGASITSIGLSSDGSTYDTESSPGSNWRGVIAPGMYLKTIYTGTAPFIFRYRIP